MNPEQQKTIVEVIAMLEHDLEYANMDNTLGAVSKLRDLLPAEDPVPYDAIVALYHARLPMLAKVKHLTATRRTQIRKRWMEFKERRDIYWWDAYFMRASRSDFLTGRTDNARHWRADFDFFLQPKSLTSLLEGKYDNRGGVARVTRDEYLDGFVTHRDPA